LSFKDPIETLIKAVLKETLERRVSPQPAHEHPGASNHVLNNLFRHPQPPPPSLCPSRPAKRQPLVPPGPPKSKIICSALPCQDECWWRQWGFRAPPVRIHPCASLRTDNSPQRKEAQPLVSRSDIRLVQYLDSSALGLVRRWPLDWRFPYPLSTPARRLSVRGFGAARIRAPPTQPGSCTTGSTPFTAVTFLTGLGLGLGIGLGLGLGTNPNSDACAPRRSRARIRLAAAAASSTPFTAVTFLTARSPSTAVAPRPLASAHASARTQVAAASAAPRAAVG
jgi:hypothetical protein